MFLVLHSRIRYRIYVDVLPRLRAQCQPRDSRTTPRRDTTNGRLPKNKPTIIRSAAKDAILGPSCIGSPAQVVPQHAAGSVLSEGLPVRRQRRDTIRDRARSHGGDPGDCHASRSPILSRAGKVRSGTFQRGEPLEDQHRSVSSVWGGTTELYRIAAGTDGGQVDLLPPCAGL
uniref:(northern house mosquito) hypothetical protein n=1 Tax=Culex pipiens TaxID=7175 RepID=A0A8D8D2I9_CULPI